MTLTDAQLSALQWLYRHNGDGAFAFGGKGKALIAAGEVAPVNRATWNILQGRGLVEYYGGKSGRARCRLTDAGRVEAAA